MTLCTVEILDPEGESASARLVLPPRVRDLRGARLGVLNTQWRSFGLYLDKLIPRLREQFEFCDVVMRIGRVGEPTGETTLVDLTKTHAVLNGLCN